MLYVTVHASSPGIYLSFCNVNDGQDVMNEEQKILKKYVVFTYFKVLFWNLLEESEETHSVLCQDIQP